MPDSTNGHPCAEKQSLFMQDPSLTEKSPHIVHFPSPSSSNSSSSSIKAVAVASKKLPKLDALPVLRDDGIRNPSHPFTSTSSTRFPKGRTAEQCIPTFEREDDNREGNEEHTDGTPCILPISKSDLWDHGSTISYSYKDGTYWDGNLYQRGKVEKVMKEMEMYLNITFVQSPIRGDIRISFRQSYTSWSFVGTQAKRLSSHEPTMNLGCINSETMYATPAEESMILHQLAHALGLLHEHHQSHSKFRLLSFEHPDEKGPAPSWTTKELNNPHRFLRKSELVKYSEMSTPVLYYVDGNKVNTQTRTNHVQSDVDKAHLMLLYPRPDPPPEWPISRALDVIGVKGEARDIILSTTQPENIRYIFLRWNEDGPAPRSLCNFSRLF